MKTIVIGMSGGMDSSTLLGYYLDKGFSAHIINFQYGSKHNEFEEKAFWHVYQYYRKKEFKITAKIINLNSVFSNFSSNLLLSGGDIPEGHYKEEIMKKTVVPGRNLIFASILAGYAESIGADEIGLGVHYGDHEIYPDCRPEFITSLIDTIEKSTENKIKVSAPFLFADKTEILKIGFSLTPRVPYYLTRTCYKNQKNSCGKCGSCQERLEAFNNLQIIDPIKYD